MSSTAIFEKLKVMVSEQLAVQPAEVKESTEIIKGLNADSLDLVEMLMNIEEEWGIVVDDEDVAGLVTINDVVKLIESKLK
ncbi:MAG TPA: acyl carrier protein [Clostridia bacterium]|nr:acyl carrier protein [Clostridia bacterium]